MFTPNDALSTSKQGDKVPRVYGKLRAFVESLNGTMIFLPGGGPGGGVWEFKLYGKTAHVEVRNTLINPLDRLYVSKVADPKTWDDYDKDANLADDVFWKLVRLFES